MASERLTFQAGDFFTDELPRCDAYLLMNVLHDWGDEEAIAILQAIRRAAPRHAKLLICELLISADPGPDVAKMMDVHMMAMPGGRQRTRQQNEALLDAASFAVNRQIDTASDIAILEAITTP